MEPAVTVKTRIRERSQPIAEEGTAFSGLAIKLPANLSVRCVIKRFLVLGAHYDYVAAATFGNCCLRKNIDRETIRSAISTLIHLTRVRASRRGIIGKTQVIAVSRAFLQNAPAERATYRLLNTRFHSHFRRIPSLTTHMGTQTIKLHGH